MDAQDVPASARTPGGRGDTTAVCIVGAGPAGLVLGHLLHRDGIPFVLLERHRSDELVRRAKAGLIEYRTVQLLRAEGIADDVLRFEVTNGRCEFRTPDDHVVFDYAALTEGRPHYLYPQHELQARLCEALLAAGADVRFGSTLASLRQDDDGVTAIVTGAEGETSTVRCQVLVGCDGTRSAVAAALSGARVVEESLPERWLAVLGAAPPLEQHTIYAAHPRGFAGQMRRGANLTRYFLEIPGTDAVSDWPEERIRAELTLRPGVPGRLEEVSLIEPSLLDLRMRMIVPMQEGRVFLAGDAAHLITPAGGKGMNLAIQGAVELAHGLTELLGRSGSDKRVSAYTDTRLPAVWRTQAFSNWMLRLIHAGSDHPVSEPAADAPGAFARGLREGWVAALQRDPLLARWFAHAYAGVDPDG